MRRNIIKSKYFKATKASLFTLLGFIVFFEITGNLATRLYHYVVADINAETTGHIISSQTYRSGKATRGHDIKYTYMVDGETYASRCGNVFRASDFLEVGFYRNCHSKKDMVNHI